MPMYNPGVMYRKRDGYGERWNNRRNRFEDHAGIDYMAPKGTDIYSAADGKVVFSGWINGYGYTEIIEHKTPDNKTFWTLYAHMMAKGRDVGTEVKAGDVIGFVGKTGDESYPYHLHFEVIPTNPLRNGCFDMEARTGRENPDSYNKWPSTGVYDYRNYPPNYEPGPFSSSGLLRYYYGSIEETLINIMSFIEGTAHAAETTRRVDPLILDFDGDGAETTRLADGAYFDHDSNVFAEQTGWASSDDGLLVMDRNNNGTIDNGAELFGDQTLLQNGQRATDGFQALAELDSNSDGVIDINDTAFSNLRIWQDIDGDGYSATDELFTLQEMGIQSINVAHTDTNTVDPQGNTQIQAGTFTKTDGSTASIGGFNLQRDVTYSIATEWLDVPDNIAALPDLQGYGNTYNLHQAMIRDTTGTLQTLINQFIAAEDPAVRDGLMDQILFKWTGSDTINPASRGPNFDAGKPQSHYLSQSPQR